MNIGAALSYPFNDPAWKRKLGLGVFFLFIPIVGQFMWIGYGIKIIEKVSAGAEDELPDWSDLGEYLRRGFVALVFFFIYLIPALFIGAVGNDSAFLILVAISLAFAGIFLFNIAVMRYSVSDTFEGFVDIGTSISLLQRNFGSVASTYFVVTVGYFAATAIVTMLTMGVVTICLSFFVLAYYYIFVGYSLGRLAPKLDLLPPNEQVFVQEQTSETPLLTSSDTSPPPSQENQPEPGPVPTPEPETSPPPERPSYTPSFEQGLKDATRYEIRLPKTTTFEPERAHSLIKQILTQLPQITFAIVAERDHIVWEIWDLQLKLAYDVIPRAVRDIYPNAEMKALPYEPPEVSESYWRYVMLYKQPVHFAAPMKYVSELKQLDPLASLVQPFADLKEGERITHMLHISSILSDIQYAEAKNFITQSTIHPLQFLSAEGWGRAAADVALGQTRTAKYSPENQKIYEQRVHTELLYNVYLMTQLDVLDPAEFNRVLSIQSSVLQFHAANGLEFSDFLSRKELQVNNAEFEMRTSAVGVLGSFQAGTDMRAPKAKAVLSAQEIAGLWHLPHDEFATPGIEWLSGAQAPKEVLENSEGVVIGDNIISGEPWPVRIHPEDRTTHMNIVGKTGVGKSTFLHNLIHQDIANGEGVGVIDPHGGLVNNILRTSIPDERLKDVVVIDIANLENPPPLNPMRGPANDDSYTASEVVAILDKIENIPSRVADTLTAAFITLRHEKTPTVRDVVRLFEDGHYRSRFINQVDDVVTQEFWRRFENLSPGRQDELAYPVLHRMRRFYRNPILHPMLCHPDSLDFQQLIRDHRIVLVSLGIDERKVPGLERQLVGIVLVSQIQMAAMSSLTNPTPFHLYIDEVQNFVTAPLQKVFEESRKYRLQLTVANQYLGQLEGKVLDSIMGTVGASCVFQVGRKDARALSTYFRPEFSEDDLVNMDKFNVAVKTRFLGNTVPSFSIATRPDPGDIVGQEALAREALIRQRSIERYTPKTKEQVLAWLDERYPRYQYTSPSNQGNGPDGVNWVVGDEKKGEGRGARAD